MSAPAIEIDAAQHTYPNGTQALGAVSLSVQDGEFLSLLGPSGCGKSTLLRMMAGLIRPSTGRIARWGQAGGEPAGGQGLSFVFQEPTLMPWASVSANVRLPLDLAGAPRREADTRVAEALDQVGLGGVGRHRPRELSGGMQMRVSIARALVTRPRLLLMDEPFGALDEITRQRLDSDLRGLWQARGLTVVFVTHSIAEAAFLSSRIVVMAARPGRVLDDLSVALPAQRSDDLRTSVPFNDLVRQLQHTLAQASMPSRLEAQP